jgi:hypothetical protein
MADRNNPGYYSSNGDRREHSSQEWGEEGWGEEGSQVDDSSRSWGSQRSDTGYLSSGALSDVAHHNYGGDRYSHAGRRNHVAAVAALLMNGETRFPSAMAYLSDAQRSDVATVCSGSVADETEVESVLSQEDQLNAQQAHNFSPINPPSERQLLAPETNGRLSSGGTHGGTSVAEFADTDTPPPETEPRATVVPGNHPLLIQTLETQTTSASASASALTAPSEFTVAYLREDEAIAMHSMGPPLNRALLLQRTGGSSPHDQVDSVKSFGSGDGMAHTHSDDGQGSIDYMEPHWNQEDTRRMENAESARKSAIDSAKSSHSKDSMSQAGTDSNYGDSDCAALVDTDDCGGSLDVETHSIETRSIHSQDEAEAPNVEMTEASKPETPEESQTMTNPLLTSEPDHSNGRMSPGGTIYKGRGVRRYQGRYMHLPLKRFHQNGVHLDSVDEGSSAFQQGPVNGEQVVVNGFASTSQWEDPRRRTPPIPMNDFQRERSRSRSRSRSPPTDGDRKPRSRPRHARPNGNDYRDDRSPERDWSRR